jgi:hypothetical protein
MGQVSIQSPKDKWQVVFEAITNSSIISNIGKQTKF